MEFACFFTSGMKTVNRNRWFCLYTGDGIYKSEQSEQPFRRLRPSLRKIMAKCVSLLCALLMLQVSRAYDGDAEEDLAPAIRQYSRDFLLQFQPVKRPMTTRLPGEHKIILKSNSIFFVSLYVFRMHLFRLFKFVRKPNPHH